MRAVDETGVVAGEKKRCLGDFLGRAQTALLKRERCFACIETVLRERCDFTLPVRGIDETRAHRIATNPALAILHGNRPREHRACALGGAIQHFERRGRRRRDRRRADNRAAARAKHVRQHGTGHREHALDVDVHKPLVVLVGGIEERFDDNAARVIEQHVDRAEALGDPCHGGFHLIGLCDISPEKLGHATALANLRGDLRAGIGVDIDNRNLKKSTYTM